MNELITWLRAQLDDDERVARDAAREDTPPWHLDYDDRGYDGKIRSAESYTVVHQEDSTPGRVTAEHIARWDPARVLAEVDAKRRILDEHEAMAGDTYGQRAGQDVCETCKESGSRYYHEPYPCPTVRLLALPFADRPGYQEGWRP
jgi:hypothetical protein